MFQHFLGALVLLVRLPHLVSLLCIYSSKGYETLDRRDCIPRKFLRVALLNIILKVVFCILLIMNKRSEHI